jgi:hypothetical protein
MHRRTRQWFLIFAVTACGGRESGSAGLSKGTADASVSISDASGANTVDGHEGSTDASENGDDTNASTSIAACDDYFNAGAVVLPPATAWAQIGGRNGCEGAVLPDSERARVRARFEQVCLNQIALPGSGISPAGLEACAAALIASPCDVYPSAPSPDRFLPARPATKTSSA